MRQESRARLGCKCLHLIRQCHRWFLANIIGKNQCLIIVMPRNTHPSTQIHPNIINNKTTTTKSLPLRALWTEFWKWRNLARNILLIGKTWFVLPISTNHHPMRVSVMSVVEPRLRFAKYAHQTMLILMSNPRDSQCNEIPRGCFFVTETKMCYNRYKKKAVREPLYIKVSGLVDSPTRLNWESPATWYLLSCRFDSSTCNNTIEGILKNTIHPLSTVILVVEALFLVSGTSQSLLAEEK